MGILVSIYFADAETPRGPKKDSGVEVTPIGIFHCAEQYPYDAARQGTIAQDNAGRIVLSDGQHYEQALQDLAGFSHIWLVYHFHQNTTWKPRVQPPRGTRKVGVFASRAPYRPNPIGLSCVRLIAIAGRTVRVADHDLLDGTPILDIKPYIPYADSIPDAAVGWLGELDDTRWTVAFTDAAKARVRWLEARGVACLEAFLVQQLTDEPFNRKRKRLKRLGELEWEIAYRTWRACFEVDAEQTTVRIHSLSSGYTVGELEDEEDRYGDKAVHRAFVAQFP